MKKFFIGVLLLSVFLLVACTQVHVEPEKCASAAHLFELEGDAVQRSSEIGCVGSHFHQSIGCFHSCETHEEADAIFPQ